MPAILAKQLSDDFSRGKSGDSIVEITNENRVSNSSDKQIICDFETRVTFCILVLVLIHSEHKGRFRDSLCMLAAL